MLIVGYQAQHTLGRRLVEQRARVRIFGVERERRAEVVVLNGFSAHADQRIWSHYAEAVPRARRRCTQVVLVHGDPKPQQILADILHVKGFKSITTPAPQDRLTIL